MKVQVLAGATEDLADGYRFFERQATGLGEYFLDSLWSEIQSLRLYGGLSGLFSVIGKKIPLRRVLSDRPGWRCSCACSIGLPARPGLGYSATWVK